MLLASTRAASVSASSPGSTGTRACARIGPASSSALDLVDRGAGLGVARSQHRPMDRQPHHAGPAVGGQQPGMDVDRPAAERGEVGGAQELVVAGQDGELDARLAPGPHRWRRRAPPHRRSRSAAGRGPDAVGRRDLERTHAGTVADDERNGSPASRMASRFEPRPETRTPSLMRSRTRGSPAGTSTTRPMRHASGSAASAASTAAAGTTAVMPMPTLKVRTISSSAMSPRCWMRLKIAGTGHDPVSTSTPRPSGRVRGTLPSQPPPVMWARAAMSVPPRAARGAGCGPRRGRTGAARAGRRRSCRSPSGIGAAQIVSGRTRRARL